MSLRPSKMIKTPSVRGHSPWGVRPHLCHLDRSEAQWRDLCVDAPSWKCFSTERTRISCHAALDTSAYAAFVRKAA